MWQIKYENRCDVMWTEDTVLNLPSNPDGQEVRLWYAYINRGNIPIIRCHLPNTHKRRLLKSATDVPSSL